MDKINSNSYIDSNIIKNDNIAIKEQEQLISKQDNSIDKINSNKYGSFNNIIENLKNNKVDKSFWNKERDNIKRIVEEGKRERESLKMSFEKFHEKYYI